LSSLSVLEENAIKVLLKEISLLLIILKK